MLVGPGGGGTPVGEVVAGQFDGGAAGVGARHRELHLDAAAHLLRHDRCRRHEGARHLLRLRAICGAGQYQWRADESAG